MMKIRSYFFILCLFLLLFARNVSVYAFDFGVTLFGNEPEIFYQRGPEDVKRGSDVDFYAYAEDENITYQWWCDGQPLADTDDIKGAATNHLSISSVSCGDNGKIFWCVLSNAYGSTESNRFSLTVKHIYDQREQNETTMIQKEACYQEGKYYYTCLCGAKGDTFTVEPLPHSGGKATCKEQAICSMCNQPYGEISGEHCFGDWQFDESDHWRLCSVCDTKIDFSAHSPGAVATETTPQLCTVCGYVIAPALGHRHQTTYVPEVPSTCTTRGCRSHYRCDCGKYFLDEAATQEIADSSSLLLLLREHSGGVATCQSYAVCDFCEREYGALANHIFNVMEHDDTYHWLECSVCGLKQELFLHQSEASDVKENTEVCKVCGYEKPILHQHDLIEIPEKEATCTEDGCISYYRCDCGKLFYDAEAQREIVVSSEITVPMSPHHGGEATCKDLAQCSECGRAYGEYGSHGNRILHRDAVSHWYQCALCGEVTGKSEHSTEKVACGQKAKCDVCGEEYGNPSEHDYSIWKYDDNVHYLVCKNCGASEAPCAHTLKQSADSTRYKKILRCDCGFEKISYSHPFKDVRASDWFYDDVIFTYHNGLLRGIKEDTFGIETETSRAMIVTILYRMEGEPKISYAPFDDVLPSHWFGESVAWAAKNGIVEGYGNGTFGPDDPVTREQIASILYRYAAYKGDKVSAAASSAAFPDASAVSAWAWDSISWAVSEGLIRGVEENGASYLRPQYHAMRTQVAAILHRFCLNRDE